MTSTEQPAKPYEELHDWLRQRDNFLIVTHQRPDGDAVGAVLAMAGHLREQKLCCRGWFDQELPRQFNAFIPDDILIGEADLASFEHLILVAGRLAW